MPGEPAIIIVLPDGGALGGVTTWAERARGALVSIGGHAAVVDETGKPIAAIREAIARIRAKTAGPIWIAPTLSGLAYANACAAVSASNDAQIGVLGSMHTDIPYDTELVRRFGPGLSGVLCVSGAARDHLVKQEAVSAKLCTVLPTGVSEPDEQLIADGPVHDPLRMLYVGRLDTFQKRTGSLIPILTRVRAAGIDATLTIVGDGAGRESIESADGVRLHGSVKPSGLAPIYASHDLLLLPSRSEGLGLSRIEAAMSGCVPIVTPGGASEGIVDGESGVVVPCDFDDADERAAERFADRIVALMGRDLAPMRRAARDSARRHFGMRRFSNDLWSLLERLRVTDTNRAAWTDWAADPDAGARITVPSDADARVRAAADGLGGASVVLHGDGAHTDAVWDTIRSSGLRVVGIADDDPRRWGRRRDGVPVLSPVQALTLGADAVLLSSWLHEDALWAKRSVYTDAGLAVHRVYQRA